MAASSKDVISEKLTTGMDYIQFSSENSIATYMVDDKVLISMKSALIEFLHLSSSPIGHILLNEISRLSHEEEHKKYAAKTNSQEDEEEKAEKLA